MRHGYITNLILFYPAWSFSQSFWSLSFFQEIVWYPPPFYDCLSISCCLASRSKWFIPGSPLFNLFYSFVPGPVYWYPSQWNSTPNLDIHFWMSNPPPCWRVLFLETTSRLRTSFNQSFFSCSSLSPFSPSLGSYLVCIHLRHLEMLDRDRILSFPTVPTNWTLSIVQLQFFLRFFLGFGSSFFTVKGVSVIWGTMDCVLAFMDFTNSFNSLSCNPSILLSLMGGLRDSRGSHGYRWSLS